MKPLKVLMVVPNLRVANGVASFAMNYYRSIDHAQVKMDFISYKKIDTPYIDEIESNGDSVFYVTSVKNIFKHYRECKRIIRAGQYDVIHDNSLLITLPLMLAGVRDVKYRILHSHSTKLGEDNKREFRNRMLLPLLIATSNRYAACSTEAGNKMFRNRKFEIIPDVIDVDKFQFNMAVRIQTRKKEQCQNKYVIATVGRLTYAKNPFFAIDVVKQVLSKNPEVEYWWIGNGELDSDVKKHIDEKKLYDRVKLFGGRGDVPNLYQAIDLFFMPSIFEGFGLACLEAETAGLQCLVSDRLPMEVDVTGNVVFMPLEKSTSEWAVVLEKMMENQLDRNGAYSKVNQSSCSNKGAGERLLNYYKAL